MRRRGEGVTKTILMVSLILMFLSAIRFLQRKAACLGKFSSYNGILVVSLVSLGTVLKSFPPVN